jgi:actin
MSNNEARAFKASFPHCNIVLSNRHSNEAVVMDTGSHMVKAGLAGSEAPRAVFPSVVGHRKKYASHPLPGIGGGLPDKALVGYEAMLNRGMLWLTYPLERGIVTDWEAMEQIWRHTFYYELRVDPADQPVLLTETPLNPKANRERMAQTMLQTFGCPALYITMQAVLVLYASAATTGCVLDSGDGGSHVVCIYEGFVVPHAIIRLDIGGRDITRYMARLLTEQGRYFRTTAELEIVREMKEMVAYMATDEQEVEDFESDAQHSYELPDGNIIDVGDVCFRAPEAMFQPSLIGKEAIGIHELVFHSIMKCEIDTRKDLCRQIILAGGNTVYEGIQVRLCNELAKLAPPNYHFTVIAPLERKYAVWIGGSILISSLGNCDSMWVTKDEYEEVGPGIVHTKCARY